MMLMMAGNYLLQFVEDPLFLVLQNSGYLLSYLSYEVGPHFLITMIVRVKIFITGIYQSLFEGLTNPTMRSHAGGDEDAWKINKFLTYIIYPWFVSCIPLG